MQFGSRETDPVYEEWASKIVPRFLDDGSCYRVFAGKVTWDDGDVCAAYTVFWQRGSEPDWTTAKREQLIDFHNPAPILESDLDKVLSALRELQKTPLLERPWPRPL